MHERQLPSGLKRQVEEPKNILISFATGAGRKVADGADRNSPFTAALLKHIEQPGIELIALMKRVLDDVVSATAGEQVPTFYISGADDAYFVAALPKPQPSATPSSFHVHSWTSARPPSASMLAAAMKTRLS